MWRVHKELERIKHVLSLSKFPIREFWLFRTKYDVFCVRISSIVIYVKVTVKCTCQGHVILLKPRFDEKMRGLFQQKYKF